VQAKRWVVVRTHAWNERARRLEAHPDRSNWAPLVWAWLAEARLLATGLARQIISFTNSQLTQRPSVLRSCSVPCDHVPVRSWPLFRARELMRDVIDSFKREQRP